MAETAIALIYILAPSTHHAVFAGLPLSFLATGVLVLLLARHTFPAPVVARGGLVVGLGVILVAKIVVTGVVPARGFRADYFPNASLEGKPYRSIDARIDFDDTTFPREFFNEFRYRDEQDRAGHPFSVVWRGWVWLPTPTALQIETSASEPVAITVDGRPLTSERLVGSHELMATFVRRMPAPPRVRVELGGDLPVFAGRVTATTRTLAMLYRPLSIGVDLLFIGVSLFAVAAGMIAAIRKPPGPRLPFGVAGLAVLAFWLISGALRAAPHRQTMEFLVWGDDWTFYEAMARNIVGGDLSGGPFGLGHGTLLYPYVLAFLHVLFGPRQWSIYFAHHVMIGLACVVTGLLAKRLWGERTAIAVLMVTTVYCLLDVSRQYAIRMLSENLVLLLVPLAFLAVEAHVRRDTVGSALVASVLLAALGLTRFNLVPFVGLALVYLIVRAVRDGKRRGASALLLAFLFVYAAMPLREAFVTGHVAVLPMPTVGAVGGSLAERWDAGFTVLLRELVLPNTAFILGYPKLRVPEFQVRPHWLLLWAAYAIWLVRRPRSRRDPTITLLHVYIALYVAVMLLTWHIFVYGYRHLLALFIVLALFFPAGVVALVGRRRGVIAAGWPG